MWTFLVAFLNAPWLATILNFAFGAGLVGLLAPRVYVAGWPLWLVLLLAALTTSLAPLAGLIVLPLLPERARFVDAVQTRLATMVRVMLAGVRDARYLARVTDWTFLTPVQASVLMWVGFVATGVEVGVAEAVALDVLLQLMTYVQITPGNLGVQELAFAALSVGFSASAADGLLVEAARVDARWHGLRGT